MYRVGTSGFSYKEWKPSFYPQDLPQRKMLHFYARNFGAVEINNTFYRMPREELLEKWCEEVPEAFCFVLKMPRRITHLKKLNEVEEDVAHFLKVSEVMGSRRGPLFAQFPPRFGKNIDRLSAFLSRLAGRAPVALEFRHPSWNDPEVHDLMRTHNAAWVVSDQLEEGAGAADEDSEDTPWSSPPDLPEHVLTADWTYLRLRRCGYEEEALSLWSKRLKDSGLKSSYVFFKHEDDATGPRLSKEFLALLGEA